MNRQKLTAICMVPIAAIALFLAWRSYKTTVAPDASSAGPRPAGMAGAGGGGGGGGQRGPTPAQMLDEMTKELALTPTQKTGIQTIQEDLAAQRKALPQTMAREERRAKMTANRAAADVKIKALLSPDQQTKYDAMQAKRRAQMQAMRPQGGGAPGGAMGGSGGMGAGGMRGGGVPGAAASK